MRPAGRSRTADASYIPVPAVRGGIVSRGWQFERLGSAARVTQVTAPAGSGKTFLLSSWVAESGLADSTAWVPVQGEERDTQRFWLSVADALRDTTAGSKLVRPLTGAPDLDGWALVERLLKGRSARLEHQPGRVPPARAELGANRDGRGGAGPSPHTDERVCAVRLVPAHAREVGVQQPPGLRDDRGEHLLRRCPPGRVLSADVAGMSRASAAVSGSRKGRPGRRCRTSGRCQRPTGSPPSGRRPRGGAPRSLPVRP